MKKPLLILFLVTSCFVKLYSQCCSQGSPMAGDANVGVLEKGGIRLSSFYKYSYSENTNVKVNHAIQEDANFNYVGLTLGYGITRKISTELELGYFLNKTQNLETRNFQNIPNFTPQKFVINGFGLSNGVFYIKHLLLKKIEKKIELSGGLGFKFPFQSKLQVVDGVELPIDNLPSTYAPGIVSKLFFVKKIDQLKMAIVLIERLDYNFDNIKGYQYGTSSVTSLIVSKNLDFISKKLTGILQFSNEYRAMDLKTEVRTGLKETIPTSGSHIIYVIPQFGIKMCKKLNTSLAIDLPIYKKYRVDKLQNIYAVTVNCSIDL